jgi:glycerophosphoryl diester phosphodiesterase
VIESLLRGGRPPLVIGHRGLPVLVPENTLSSFALALELGADGVEVDVVALADGVLVAGHSLDLAELCHGAATGEVGARTLEELRHLDPRLATLDDVLELARTRLGDRLLLLDLKSEGQEPTLVEKVRAYRLEAQTIFCSPERRQLVRLRELATDIARAVSYPADRRRLSERRVIAPFVPLALRVFKVLLRLGVAAWVGETRAAAMSLHQGVIDPALVRRCHDRGVAVIAWTVNDADVRRRLIEAGIDAIITDDPRPLPAPTR